MSYLTRKTVLQAKSEASYNSAPSMDTSDAILVSNLDLGVDPEQLERNNFRDTISSDGIIIGKKIFSVSFDVELKGIGSVPTNSDPLEYDALLKACGLTTAYSSGGTYTVWSDDTNMVSTALEFNYDGLKYYLSGAFGTLGIELVAGQFGVIHFEFKGLYNSPTDQTQISPSFASSEKPPIIENIDFSYNSSTDLITQSLIVNLNNEVVERPDLNSSEGLKGLYIASRNVQGNFNPEMVARSTMDFYDFFENTTEKTIGCTIGSTAGNKFDLDMTGVELLNLPPGDRDGIRTFECEYVARGDDDEFVFKGY